MISVDAYFAHRWTTVVVINSAVDVEGILRIFFKVFVLVDASNIVRSEVDHMIDG